ncbi:MAG TPA: nucleoside-diphosphate sugar epimerase/dehydratase, partial [Bryobacteraceae bacterium]|nr:nucleoside-diphosphate sugar epimerase/dehydratase [Bryobacteraceae bacterium]
MAVVQIAIFLASGIGAFLLRFDFRIPVTERNHLALALAVWVVVKSGAFRYSRLERGWWQYVSISDVTRIFKAILFGTILAAVVIRLLAGWSFPRSVFILDFNITFMASVWIRVLVRVNAESLAQNRPSAESRRTLIYGAGAAGVKLLREIDADSKLLYTVVGFIDDNPGKRGIEILGVPVMGSGENLRKVVREKRIDEILIAIPSADGPQMMRMLDRCQNAHVPCKTIPGLAEIIQANGLARQIRNVEVEDLLGRTPVHLKEFQQYANLEGRVVMVTGAGGSIGSELCRQIAHAGPAALVAYEISESALFKLGNEMRAQFPDLDFYAEIGNIQNSQRLTEVMRARRPSVLYHAAAYKHLPMMEVHPFEAVENNVFGTVTTLLCAAECGLSDFVFISTDKAVHPTSVMGATKRVAELAIDSFRDTRIKCVSVRFGNVLGSTGSVVPLFREQIAKGGPVQVTHPEMERYFMTIPEAVQLVLQASSMGKGGEIFVLDMGLPVKILDLAKKMILLSGFRPGEDIRIEFTGIRPGEKLREETQQVKESVLPTHHEKIKILRGSPTPPEQMRKLL